MKKPEDPFEELSGSGEWGEESESADMIFPAGPAEPGARSDAPWSPPGSGFEPAAGAEGEVLPAGPAEKTTGVPNFPSAFGAPRREGEDIHIREPHDKVERSARKGGKKSSTGKKEKSRLPLILGGVAAVVVLAGIGFGAKVYFDRDAPVNRFAGSTGDQTPEPTPPGPGIPPPGGGPTTSGHSVSTTNPGQTPSVSPTPPGPPAPAPTVGEIAGLLPPVSALTGQLSPASQAALKQAEEKLLSPNVSEEEISASQAWANQVRETSDDEAVQDLVSLIDILSGEETRRLLEGRQQPEPASDSEPDASPSPDAGASAAFGKVLAFAAMLSSNRAAVFTATAALLQGDAAPPNMDPRDQRSWRTNSRLFNDEQRTPDQRVAAAFNMALLCRNYGQPGRALRDYCAQGMRIVNQSLQQGGLPPEAETALRQRDRQLRGLWEELNAEVVADLASASQQASDSAQAAADAATAANQAAMKADQAASAGRVATAAFVAQLQQRLADAKRRNQDAGVAATIQQHEAVAARLLQDLQGAAALDALLPQAQQLASDVRQLESQVGSVEAAPVVATAEEVEQFLATLQLPKEQELVGKGEVFANSRFKPYYDQAQQDLAWLRDLVNAPGNAARLSPQQAQEAQTRVRRTMYNALILETRKQIVALPPSTGSGSPSGSLPESLVNEQELHAAMTAAREEMLDLRRSLDARQRAVESRLSQTQRSVGQVTSEVGQVQSRLDAHKADAVQRDNAVRQELLDRIGRAMAGPRPVPAGQFDALSQEVSQRVLDTLADYGYTPRVAAPDSEGNQPVGPLASVADPALALNYYLAGFDAYHGGASEEALRQFARAAHHDPDNPIYRYYLGLALRRAGRYAEASAQVQAGKKLHASYRRYDVGAALEPIQGDERLWLERL